MIPHILSHLKIVHALVRPVFLPGESQGRGAWWSAVYGVAQSRTRLEDLAATAVSLFLSRLSDRINSEETVEMS